MNSVTLMGRLTRDPELSYNNTTGNAMARFSVAVDKQLSREKKQEMESRNQPTADFLNVVCWGRLAESVNSFTAKGKRVLIQGRIQTGSYEAQDGTRRYTTDIVANSVEFIDWKDRDGGYAQPSRTPYPNNEQAQSGNKADDDFLGSDFSPVDDERIPF
uniref:single-stranded DNA-binding protein n=1 Tax=Ndongobacter massiliensis TaxID=1871025 RepID=UPI0009318C36|nr:single-stranded DNA-binding protein [Ndongobacter massiliensis]